MMLVSMDILYQDEAGIKVALGQSQTSSDFTITDLSDFLLTSFDDPDCGDLDPADKLSTPNSNAFIDLDGDCLPDLFMTLTNVDNISHF